MRAPTAAAIATPATMPWRIHVFALFEDDEEEEEEEEEDEGEEQIGMMRRRRRCNL